MTASCLLEFAMGLMDIQISVYSRFFDCTIEPSQWSQQHMTCHRRSNLAGEPPATKNLFNFVNESDSERRLIPAGNRWQ